MYFGRTICIFHEPSHTVVAHPKKKWRDWPASYDLFAIIIERVQICRNFTEDYVVYCKMSYYKMLYVFEWFVDYLCTLCYSVLINFYHFVLVLDYIFFTLSPTQELFPLR